MKILILSIVAVVFFLITALCRKWKNVPVLIAVTIAAAVNTNYTVAYEYRVGLGALILGVDSIVAFLYLYNVIIMCIEVDTKRAYSLCFNSVAAIVLAGVIETSALTASHGALTLETMVPFLFNFVSACGCMAAGLVAIYIADRLKTKTKVCDYAIVLTTTLIGSIIHSAIFSLGYMIKYVDIFDNMNTYLGCICGGLVEKGILIILGIVTLLFARKVLKIKIERNS